MRLSDLGLPPKFRAWRPGQLNASILAACSDTRFTVLNMPPGTGKTPMYVAASRMLEGRTLILTHTKGLQAQITGDFVGLGLREIKGQANYPCVYLDEQGTRANCDEGPCHAGAECPLKANGCYYFDAVRAARSASIVVANYSYWMHIQRYAEPDALGQFDLLVLDEAHEAVNILSDFVRTHLDRKEIKRLVGLDLIKSTHLPEWVEWAEYAIKECKIRLESAKNSAVMYREGIKAVRALKELEANLLDLVLAAQWKRSDVPNPAAWVPGQTNDWIIEQTSSGVTFQPVWPHAYAEHYLFGGIPRVLLVSATVTRRDAIYLGVPDSSLTFKSYPSPFHRDTRPVYFIPTARVGRKSSEGEERIWLNRIDEIIGLTEDRKGIVHTVSYDRARLICENSRHADRLICHDSRSTRSAVQRFRDSGPGTVLVSPAVSTGWDFPGDQCRFQIIAKIPFTDGRELLAKARSKRDKGYLNYLALVELIQMSGRGVRSEDDWCDTFLIDDHWFWFSRAIDPDLPRWFKAGIKKVRYVRDIRLHPMAAAPVLTGRRRP